mmetsp:Transcript_6425/g.9333  ORF Transcript_6425/g.9333 Transcript_6425/m.9333 type:complete len:1156 (-) Transcript_6425:162-3629(-)|eukprot:CAMPEP_0184861904 /NCGR_PEP_ID=MMETSP0580-20130426/6483_1 /TAXON_ID=1118495 /ORGANISM="Dactyliosolen fragilissimus" /LENGTH=1155 /DNA_ID=CAMNT_0027359571 /DNA_START=121 /DNA_END=3588 /DNA_ORIENTATION=+
MKLDSKALTFLLSISAFDNGVSGFGGYHSIHHHQGSSCSSMINCAGNRRTFVSPNARIIQNGLHQQQQQKQQSTSSSPLTKKSSTMTMLVNAGGIEELKEMAKEGDKLSKTVRKTPTLFKVSGLAAVPVSAILGAVMTPSRRIAAHAVGSAITGVAGYIGKSRLDAATEDAAKPAIAQLIVDQGLNDPQDLSERLTDLQNAFGVQDEDFEEMTVDVYKRYLTGMVKTPITQTSEVKDLQQLKQALSLSNLSIGEAHAMAAKDFYRHTCLFTPVEELDDPDHPDRMSIDKFLFLSERTFKNAGETTEAFKFEMSRVAKAFDLKLEAAMDRVADVAEPFYKRALESTREKLDADAVNSDMLQRARTSLGIDDATSNDMHLLTYSDEIKSLLGKTDSEDIDLATLKFGDNAETRLTKLKDVLQLEDREADYEIYAEATPLFQKTALASMNEAIAGTKSAEKAWEEISSRQRELLLKGDAMKDLLASMVMQAMGKPLEDTLTFAKVNNEAATYDKLLDALDAKEACISVLKSSGWEEFNAENFDATFFDPSSKSSACGFLSYTDRSRLYGIFLTRAVRKSESGTELTDEYYAKVKEVQGMLGISEADEMRQFRTNFGPELQKTLNMAMFEIMGDDYTPALVTNLQKSVEKVIHDYRLSEDLVAEFALPLYTRAVAIVSDDTPSGVPEAEKMEQLNSLCGLLKMKKDDTYAAHFDVFGGAYKSAILESMGSTGVIRPELRGPLDDLKSRLGVSEESTHKLFLEAVEERMKPMVDWIVLELERTMLTPAQLAQKRKQDFGEDYFKTGKGADGNLGLGAEANIMTDIMNLIDFYTENDIIEQKEIGKKIIQKKVQEGDEEKTVEEEVPEYETIYPITALENCSIETEIAELLYRQFVVGGFTSQGPQGQRYEASRATFGGILGLEEEKMKEITKDIGGTVYENYIGNSMRTKGALDQQDMMFLANIQGKLEISSETSEKMLLETQKKILSEDADVILEENTTPELIKAFREKCNSMGMELEADVGISKARLIRMFEEEVTPALVNGEITIENGDILSEIQESLGLSPEEAEKIFENLLDKRAKSALTRIKSELLRGREENAVDTIVRLVRYAQFVNGELDLEVDEATAWKIFNLYESMDFGEENKDDVAQKKELLSIALNLS